MMRKSWTTRGILGAVAVLIAIALAAGQRRGRREATPSPAPAPGPTSQQRPLVEVVFVLDTTGSMSGMIEGAKSKIWQIASHIVSGQPTPEVRIGLVAYRDKQDAYVTEVVPLTGDLDVVYNRLTALRAEGGGDGPEHVNRALHDALGMAWSDGAMKMIFLVGDAPPHDDYTDVPTSGRLAEQARDHQIVVHTVRCGQLAETGTAWQAIASVAGGRFTTIEQDGGVVTVATPLDGRLAELNRRLTEANILYGGADVRAAYGDKVRAGLAAPASAAADRARFFASAPKGHKMADEDILDDLADGTIDPATLEEEKLPEPMKGLSPAQRKDQAARLRRTRDEIAQEIKKLSDERRTWLKGNGPAGRGSLDDAVEGAISEQGKKHGIAY